jgi:hypothetical protein
LPRRGFRGQSLCRGRTGGRGQHRRQLRKRSGLRPRHGPRLQHGDGRRGRSRAPRFRRSYCEHPDHDPDRCAQCLGLRPEDGDLRHLAGDPARFRRADDLGLPRPLESRRRKVSSRLSGSASGMPRLTDRRLHKSALPNRRPGRQALHRQPERLHGSVAAGEPRRADLPGPRTPLACRRLLSADDGMRSAEIRSRLQPRADDQRDRLAFWPRHPAQGRSVPRGGIAFAVDASLGDPHHAPGSDDQSRRGRRAELVHRRPGGFRHRSGGTLPRQREDRHGRRPDAGSRRPAPRLAVHRRTEAGRSVQSVHDLRRLRHPRQALRLGQT